MDAYAKKDFLSSLKETRTQASWFFHNYYFGDEEFDEEYYIEDDPDIYWIGNNLSIGDIFVSLDDIETIAREEIPCKVFLSWYDFAMEYEEGIPKLNLHTFHQFYKEDNAILENPIEWVKNWDKKNQERINTPEFKAEQEECERLLIEEFIKNIDKRNLEK